MAKDIHTLWMNEFLYICSTQKKENFGLIKNAFKFLNLSLVRVKAEERMNMETAYEIILAL